MVNLGVPNLSSVTVTINYTYWELNLGRRETPNRSSNPSTYKYTSTSIWSSCSNKMSVHQIGVNVRVITLRSPIMVYLVKLYENGSIHQIWVNVCVITLRTPILVSVLE